MDRLGVAALIASMALSAGCVTTRPHDGRDVGILPGTPLLRVPQDEDEAFEQLLAQCPKPETASVSTATVIIAAYLGGCVIVGTSIVVDRIQHSRFDGTAVAATVIAGVATVGEGAELLYGIFGGRGDRRAWQAAQDEQREHFRYLEKPERRALARRVAEQCEALPLFEQQFPWGPPPPPPATPPATIPAAQPAQPPTEEHRSLVPDAPPIPSGPLAPGPPPLPANLSHVPEDVP